MMAVAPKSANRMKYDEAILYCAFCDHDDHTDWRMPTYAEYRSNLRIDGWYVNDTRGGLWKVTPVRGI